MFAWLLLFLLAEVVLSVVALSGRVRCRAMTEKDQQCSKYIRGFFGCCQHHGRAGLFLRRKCGRCGARMEFRRDYATGWPLLGCSGFPRCKRTLVL